MKTKSIKGSGYFEKKLVRLEEQITNAEGDNKSALKVANQSLQLLKDACQSISKLELSLNDEIGKSLQGEEKDPINGGINSLSSEEMYRSLVDNSVVGVFSSTLDGRLIFANEALAKMYEFDSPEEMMAKGAIERWLDMQKRDQFLSDLQDTGSVSNYEAITVTNSGKQLHTLLSLKLIGDTTYGMLIDITQRKMAEAEHEKLFNASFDLLCIAGVDGYFKELNPSWEKATGYTLRELCSKPFIEFIHPDDREKTTQEVELLAQGNPTINFENRYLKKNGEFLHLSWMAVHEPNRNLIYCSARDITSRKIAEIQSIEYQQSLKELANELIVSEEKVRKEVAADLHDHVGQLLTSSRMYLSSIIEQQQNDDLKNKIRTVSKSLREASRVTRDAIQHLSIPQLNEIGLSAAVQDWLTTETISGIGLKVNFTSNIDGVHLNEETRILLFRSIKELVINVLKHAQASLLIVSLNEKENVLEIKVEDDGIGFNYNPELVKLKSKSYGLFSIQERISNLGGSFIMDSSPLQGTRIKLGLPIQDNK